MTEIITTNEQEGVVVEAVADNTVHVDTTPASKKSRPLYRGVQTVWYILDVLEVVLLFRFILKLFGANPSAGFTQFIYGLTYPFAQPFLNVFQSTRVSGATFEWTTLLAMLVYWLVAWGIVRLFVMNKPISTTEADYRLRNQDERINR